MTVRELIVALEALPNEQKDFPVAVYGEYENDEVLGIRLTTDQPYYAVDYTRSEDPFILIHV